MQTLPRDGTMAASSTRLHPVPPESPTGSALPFNPELMPKGHVGSDWTNPGHMRIPEPIPVEVGGMHRLAEPVPWEHTWTGLKLGEEWFPKGNPRVVSRLRGTAAGQGNISKSIRV